MQDYNVKVRKLAVKPRSIGKGSPGNMPFLSSILKAKKLPSKMPTMEAKHETRPKYRSMCPESIE